MVFVDENHVSGKARSVSYEGIAQRGDLKAVVTVPMLCHDHPLHVYMFFVSENGKLASSSEYLGVVTPVESVAAVVSSS